MYEPNNNRPRIVLARTGEGLASYFEPPLEEELIPHAYVSHFPVIDHQINLQGMLESIMYEGVLATSNNATAQQIETAFIEDHEIVAQKIDRPYNREILDT